jgi:hypothetical protein
LDNSVFADCGDYGGSPASLSELADGQHTFRVKASDADGNTSAAATATWTVDTIAPSAFIQQLGNSTRDTANFILSSTENVSFTCSVDGADYSACPSALTLGSQVPLTEGPHTLLVKATDDAGNTSTATSASWTVDTIALAPVLTGVPADNTTSTTASIGISGEANATFVCSVDGAEYSFCSSPLALTGLSTGEHVVLIKQTDEAGNTSPEATASWTIVTPVVPGTTAAPRLIAQVGLHVTPNTKVTTLTLKAVADRSRGANSVKWIEYYSHPKRPAANARQNPGKIRKYATTVTLPKRELAFWVRVKDTKGKWSGWYRTRFKPNAIGW